MIWIIMATIVLLGVVALAVAWTRRKEGKKHEPNYKSFFLMGLIWLAIGLAYMLWDNSWEFNALFSLGIIFAVMGLAGMIAKPKTQKQRTVWIALVILAAIVMVVIMELIYAFT